MMSPEPRRSGVEQGGIGGNRAERIAVWRRLYLTLEMLAIYVLMPVAIYHLLYDYHLPLLAILPSLVVFFVILLTLDPDFSWRRTLSRGIGLRELASILVIFALAAPAI
jgi:hypothetical protein